MGDPGGGTSRTCSWSTTSARSACSAASTSSSTGTTSREAATVAEARRELERATPDVILLDVHVGADDGLELLDEIAALELPTRVVLLSGTSEVGPELRARVDSVLGKPFELERLAAAVAGPLLR